MNNVSANRLKEVLNDLRLSQQHLSELSGVSKANISNYINGKRKPSNITSQQLANVLKVSPLWLMGFDVPKYDNEKIRAEQLKAQESIIIEEIKNAEQEKRISDMNNHLFSIAQEKPNRFEERERRLAKYTSAQVSHLADEMINKTHISSIEYICRILNTLTLINSPDLDNLLLILENENDRADLVKYMKYLISQREE